MGKVMKCNCISEFQDSVYGKGKRYYNTKSKDRKLTGYTCTVCGHNETATSGDKKNEEVVTEKGKKEKGNKK
jgi:hypothetical protein